MIRILMTANVTIVLYSIILCTGSSLSAAEYHVALTGDNANDGSVGKPFKTIQAAANVAQPGDVITVHAGTYRERINTPRGGTSDRQRITYQTAPGEKVVITGSESLKTWKKVSGDTWKVVIPNKFFGSFNPYADRIHGDWCLNPHGQHSGAVYLNADWFIEATNLDQVTKPAGKTPLWYATVDGAGSAGYLVNVAWFKAGSATVPAIGTASRNGTQNAACTEGGQCVGFIRAGNWLRYEGVDFGAASDSVELRVASATEASEIEIRADNADGELLGTAKVAATGDWQKWVSVPVKLKPVAGKKNICLVITAPKADTENTTIWAQFPGVNPNEADVEINVRKTVFTPDRTGINYITVRGFTLRNAATNWAPPTAGQIGLVTAYWNKGWIIENNDIGYSTCSGVALGKYGDEWDNRAGSASGYVGTINRALQNGWNKETIGSHIVRNNRIHHCEQTGIVGSLGCAFSTVTGNDIHDIHTRPFLSGAEQAGIKFHGAVEVVISNNHIYRCGSLGGVWLDWMAQGAQVIGNLMHDNRADHGASQDLFLEVNHGPVLVANNILLSTHSLWMQSQGIAFAHNLFTGTLNAANCSGQLEPDHRKTPYFKPHSTAQMKLHGFQWGDMRFYNNLFTFDKKRRPKSTGIDPYYVDKMIPNVGFDLNLYQNATLPITAAGNVYLKDAPAYAAENNAIVQSEFDPRLTLIERPDGWYLEITTDKTWATAPKRPLITTELLGKAIIPDQPFTTPTGAPVKIDTDYFGNKRNPENPFPGPFEIVGEGKQSIKVWPKP